MSYSIFSVFAVLGNLKQNGCHGNSIHFRKTYYIRRKFFEYAYKVKLTKFQLPSFRRSAVTNENSLGGQALPPPPGKIGLNRDGIVADIRHDPQRGKAKAWKSPSSNKIWHKTRMG